MTELQQTLYQMLKEIHGICVENKIKYTLHPILALFLKSKKDIQAHYESRCVYMTPSDLSRFISVCGASLPPGRSLESVRSNPRYPFLYSARYVNTDTLCLDVRDGPNYINNGLFIRVEALRTYPASKVKKKFVSLLEHGWYANTYQASIDYTKKIVISKVLVRCMMVIGRARLGNLLFDLVMRAYQSKGKKVAITWKNANRFFPKALFKPKLYVLPTPEEQDEDLLRDEDDQDEDVQDEDDQGEDVQDENAQDENAQGEDAQDEDDQDEDAQGEDDQDENAQGEDDQEESAQGEDDQEESAQDEDDQEESAQDENAQGEDDQDESSQDESTQDEDARGEDAQGEDDQGEDAQNEDAQDEDAQDEDALGEEGQDEDARDEDDEQDEYGQDEDAQDEEDQEEGVAVHAWDKDRLGAKLDARLDKIMRPPVDPSQVECFYIPKGWKKFLQSIYGKKKYRRILRRAYTLPLSRIESTDMSYKDLQEKFPKMEEFFSQRRRLRSTKKEMSRLFSYRNYCWAMANMAGDKYQLKNYYDENRSRILNLYEGKKYKKLMIMFAPYQKAQQKYASYGQTFSLDEELDAIYYKTLRRNKKVKFARKMKRILKANNK